MISLVSYLLFASADTRIYPHAASQYHARPKAKRGIAMLSVDKFTYPGKQTRGNKFIPWSNDVRHILKCFRSFKTPAIPFILSKSSYKLSFARWHRSDKKVDGGRDGRMIAIVTSSMSFLSLYISCWWRQMYIYISRLLANQKRESAPSMG